MAGTLKGTIIAAVLLCAITRTVNKLIKSDPTMHTVIKDRLVGSKIGDLSVTQNGGGGKLKIGTRRVTKRSVQVDGVKLLLLISLLSCGDVERNPGPNSKKPTLNLVAVPPPPHLPSHSEAAPTTGTTARSTTTGASGASACLLLPARIHGTGEGGSDTSTVPIQLTAGSSGDHRREWTEGQETCSILSPRANPSSPAASLPVPLADAGNSSSTTSFPSFPAATGNAGWGREGSEAGAPTRTGAQNSTQELNSNNSTTTSQPRMLRGNELGKGLRFLHLNVRSVYPKMTELRYLVDKYEPIVFAISESWLDTTVGNSEIAIEGYNVVRKDRNRRGGGVMMYINNSIAHKTRNDLMMDNHESLWMELLLPNTKPIVVGVCYRPPDDNTFLEKLNRTLSDIDARSETIILGDMNICFDNRSSALTKHYKQILDLNSYKQIITTPTRITEQTSNILDHIMCNREDRISHSGVIETGLSDHFLIYCTRKHQRRNIGRHNSITIRSLRNYSKDAYENLLREANWRQLYSIPEVDEAWSTFKEMLTEIINKVAPKKEIRIKNRTDPWLNNELLHQIETRDRLLKQLSNNRSSAELRQEFNRTRNKLARDIKTAKAEYFHSMAEENKHDPRKLWKVLKKTGYKEQPKGAPDMVLNINGGVCHDKNEVANHFNTFFTTIAGTLAQSLPPPINKFTTNTPRFQNYYTNKGILPRSHRLSTVSIDFTLRELAKLKTNKSTGPDGLPARFLKDGARILAEPLTYIINLSILTETVPRELKEALVTPIFKKGDRLNVSNYRPVSILCIVAKIMERAVYMQLDNYLKDNEVLYAFQSGFRGKYSTETCLIHLMDNIRVQMAKGNYTGLVLMDLQKAFDTVDHDILCNKLETMGIGSTNWFRSYLSNRTQRVRIGDTVSVSKSITCGVPQGSILGPLLFLCYVNDMPSSVECKLLLYADDSVLMVSHTDAKAISDTLTKELESCNEWLIDNKLSLHLGKTESMLCGTKSKIRNREGFEVKCKDTAIDSVSEVKYLGIKIDETLSGEGIMDSIVKKCTGRIKFMYRQAGCFPKDVKRTLCNSLVQCHLDYAIASWYAAMPAKAKRKLQVVQNKMVRFILGVGSRTHLTTEHMCELDFLRVADRAKQIRINNAHKIFYSQSPGYLQENFVRTRDRLNQHTRGRQWNYKVPSVKGTESRTFYYNAIKDWNSLPNALKSCENVGLFKKGLKKFLSQVATDEARSDFAA